MEFKKLFSDLRELLFQRKNPVTSLTVAYIVALGIIAFLTILSHTFSSHITNKQREGANVAYHLGRQRALVQEIVLKASEYYRNGSPIELDFLNLATNEMKQGHEFLMNMISENNFLGKNISPELEEIYFDVPYRLDDRVDVFLKTTTEFAEIPVQEEPERRKEKLDNISKTASDFFNRAFDAALEKYQQESLAKTARYHKLQFWSGVLVLLVLILEAMFIFQPLVRRIGKYHKMLLRDALVDELTSLYNRRAFMRQAGIELQRSLREQYPVAVVLTDLDNFKSVNDTYGHEVGDAVLIHFSRIVKSSLRGGDTVGRIGGEEFAFILPKIDESKAFQIVDRLRQNIASTPCPYEKGKKELSYTASFGLVIAEPGNWNIDALLKEADINLYKAKHNGRNNVVTGILKPHATVTAKAREIAETDPEREPVRATTSKPIT